MVFNLRHPGFGQHSFEFSGESAFARSGEDVEFALLTSGSLVLRKRILADVFIADAGENGGTGYSESSYYVGGDGGDGGLFKAFYGVELLPGTYSVNVGSREDGASPATTFGDLSTEGSQPIASSAGGDGAVTATDAPQRGGDGVLAWNDEQTLIFPGRHYCSGGSGGGAYYDENQHDYDYSVPGGTGGSGGSPAVNYDGGGAGGYSGHPIGYDSGTNSGSGAGGGYFNGTYFAGGKGGSGIILIRKHKEVAAA